MQLGVLEALLLVPWSFLSQSVHISVLWLHFVYFMRKFLDFSCQRLKGLIGIQARRLDCKLAGLKDWIEDLVHRLCPFTQLLHQLNVGQCRISIPQSTEEIV